MQKRLHTKNWNAKPKKRDLPAIFQAFNLRQVQKAYIRKHTLEVLKSANY